MCFILCVGFRKLSIDLQIAKVQMSMYPIVLTVLSTDYNLEEQKYNYFNFSKEEEKVNNHTYSTFSLGSEPHHSRPVIFCDMAQITACKVLKGLTDHFKTLFDHYFHFLNLHIINNYINSLFICSRRLPLRPHVVAGMGATFIETKINVY